jgi:hypothetical protein
VRWLPQHTVFVWKPLDQSLTKVSHVYMMDGSMVWGREEKRTRIGYSTVPTDWDVDVLRGLASPYSFKIQN